MENTISLPVIILTLGFFSTISFGLDNVQSSDESLFNSDLDFDQRSQDLGLGKRVYGYLSQYKRLPVYNFGLGKREHLYNFGLGKRSGIHENAEKPEEYDEYSYYDEDQIPEIEMYHDDNMQSMDKRQKLYSFGLGKRLHRYDFGLGKRGQVHRYDFGLGKRALPNRDKLYNFGLGKRTRLYSFGLGKRPYNQGPVPSRFNFGLGKRSEDLDVSKTMIVKREVREENPPETVHEDGKPLNSAQVSTNKLEKFNSTAELESHEIMGHSSKSQISKRSPYKFDSETGKNPSFRANAGFSRQFRKPQYNFGLGKRTFSVNNQATHKYKFSKN